MYHYDKLYELDFTDSHLSDDEIADIIQRNKESESREREKKLQRREMRSSFRFVGGLC